MSLIRLRVEHWHVGEGLHCRTVKADGGKVGLELERVEDADLSAHIRNAVET